LPPQHLLLSDRSLPLTVLVNLTPNRFTLWKRIVRAFY